LIFGQDFAAFLGHFREDDGKITDGFAVSVGGRADGGFIGIVGEDGIPQATERDGDLGDGGSGFGAMGEADFAELAALFVRDTEFRLEDHEATDFSHDQAGDGAVVMRKTAMRSESGSEGRIGCGRSQTCQTNSNCDQTDPRRTT